MNKGNILYGLLESDYQYNDSTYDYAGIVTQRNTRVYTSWFIAETAKYQSSIYVDTKGFLRHLADMRYGSWFALTGDGNYVDGNLERIAKEMYVSYTPEVEVENRISYKAASSIEWFRKFERASDVILYRIVPLEFQE